MTNEEAVITAEKLEINKKLHIIQMDWNRNHLPHQQYKIKFCDFGTGLNSRTVQGSSWEECFSIIDSFYTCCKGILHD